MMKKSKLNKRQYDFIVDYLRVTETPYRVVYLDCEDMRIEFFHHSDKFVGFISHSVNFHEDSFSFMGKKPFSNYVRIHCLGKPTYITPFPIIPPIPSRPYLVLSKSSNKSISSLRLVKATVTAIMAGSNA